MTLKADTWGYVRGKYKGIVTAVGESAYTGMHIVRVMVKSAPARQRWSIGTPMHVRKDLVVPLPTKRRLVVTKL